MTSDRGMFRVYRCPNCNYTGIQRLENEEEASDCTLCSTVIVDEPGTLYAATRSEAETLLRELMMESRAEQERTRPKRGLGVRRRILNIVEALVDMNRGRPVTVERVMRDATDAGIELSKANRHLYGLIESGEIIQTSDGVMPTYSGVG